MIRVELTKEARGTFTVVRTRMVAGPGPIVSLRESWREVSVQLRELGQPRGADAKKRHRGAWFLAVRDAHYRGEPVPDSAWRAMAAGWGEDTAHRIRWRTMR